MIWVPNGIDANIGLSVGHDVEIEFQVGDHTPDDITLVLGDSVVEIRFDPAAVESLRDKADTALREFRDTAARRRASGLVGAAKAMS